MFTASPRPPVGIISTARGEMAAGELQHEQMRCAIYRTA